MGLGMPFASDAVSGAVEKVQDMLTAFVIEIAVEIFQDFRISNCYRGRLSSNCVIYRGYRKTDRCRPLQSPVIAFCKKALKEAAPFARQVSLSYGSASISVRPRPSQDKRLSSRLGSRKYPSSRPERQVVSSCASRTTNGVM